MGSHKMLISRHLGSYILRKNGEKDEILSVARRLTVKTSILSVYRCMTALNSG